MERGGGTRSEHRCRTSGNKVNWVSGSGSWVVPFPGRAGLGKMLPWGGVQSLRCLRDPGGDLEPSAWSLAGQERSPQRGWGLVWELGKGSTGEVWQKNSRTAEPSVPTAKRRESALRAEWWQCQVPMGDGVQKPEQKALPLQGCGSTAPSSLGKESGGPKARTRSFGRWYL